MPANPPATDTDMQVRATIAAELRRRKESKAALGRAIGLSGFQLNRRFFGTFPFQVDELKRIAAHWEVTVQDILDGLPDTEGE